MLLSSNLCFLCIIIAHKQQIKFECDDRQIDHHIAIRVITMVGPHDSCIRSLPSSGSSTQNRFLLNHKMYSHWLILMDRAHLGLVTSVASGMIVRFFLYYLQHVICISPCPSELIYRARPALCSIESGVHHICLSKSHFIVFPRTSKNKQQKLHIGFGEKRSCNYCVLR